MAVVLAGHGKGSANEARNFWHYMGGHNQAIAKKIMGVLTTDCHETEKQLLTWADELVGEAHIGHHNG